MAWLALVALQPTGVPGGGGGGSQSYKNALLVRMAYSRMDTEDANRSARPGHRRGFRYVTAGTMQAASHTARRLAAKVTGLFKGRAWHMYGSGAALARGVMCLPLCSG